MGMVNELKVLEEVFGSLIRVISTWQLKNVGRDVEFQLPSRVVLKKVMEPTAHLNELVNKFKVLDDCEKRLDTYLYSITRVISLNSS